MKDNQDTGINTNPEQGPAFASRRTIVKGLASALPVVMTIGCGKAMANASNHQCIQQPEIEPPVCIDEGEVEDPAWLRVPTEIDVKDKGITTTTTQQCLVYVDESGNEVKNRTGKSFPVTLSCYASFM